MKTIIISLGLLACIPCAARGAWSNIHAETPSTWNEYKVSVICATVDQIREVKHYHNGGGAFAATLVPMSTIAGHFDPSASRTLKVSFDAGSYATSVVDAPPKGSLILAVIRELPSGEYIIEGNICNFMPDEIDRGRSGSSIAILKGLDDPKIVATQRVIQAARAKQPATRPATRKGA